MNRGVSRWCTILAGAMIMVLNTGSALLNNGLTAESLTPGNSARKGAAPAARPGAASQERRGMGSGDLEREAEESLKAQELKKLDANIDNKIRKLDETRKSMESALSQKQKADGERYQKMVKLYKALRPEEAAKLMDKMEEDLAMELMSRMDQKTLAKIIPYLNQARVLKWTRLSLRGN